MKRIFSLLLVFCSISTLANTPLPNGPHIAVTGTAKMTAMPDVAIVHLSLEAIKKTSIAAKRDVDLRVNNLLDGLEAFDIQSDNVSASSISTEVRYAYNRGERNEIEGYVARRTLKVTLSHIEHLNNFMDFALKVEVNSIQNIELKSSKAEQLKQEANALAVADAKAKGKQLAQAFDAQLGKIYSINSSTQRQQHRYGANSRVEYFAKSADMAEQKSGRYLQENIIFSASVSVVFDLEP